jgi:hypothetical protein
MRRRRERGDAGNEELFCMAGPRVLRVTFAAMNLVATPLFGLSLFLMKSGK